MTESALPQEAEKLLALEPGTFVAERDRIARKLRDENRPDDAATAAGLRKPTVVVFAVNRAARDRPKAARDASEAALRVKETQVGTRPEAFKQAFGDLDSALDLLAEVAVAHVAPPGKAPTDTMRRRVRDLLRSAVADDDAREALVRGALTEELEAVGFSPFAGMAPATRKERKRAKRRSAPTRAEQQEAKRRKSEQALREALAEAEERLQEAAKKARDAERDQKVAEREVASLRTKLERARAR